MPEELAFDCFVLILETSFFQEQNVVFVFSIMLQDSCAAFPVFYSPRAGSCSSVYVLVLLPVCEWLVMN